MRHRRLEQQEGEDDEAGPLDGDDDEGDDEGVSPCPSPPTREAPGCGVQLPQVEGGCGRSRVTFPFMDADAVGDGPGDSLVVVPDL